MGELLGVAELGGLRYEARIRGITAGGKVAGSKKKVVGREGGRERVEGGGERDEGKK